MLIALEGGEGCGKSTQARLLADRLGAVLTFEPGATPVGRELRRVLLEGSDVDPRAEALLMAGDRAEHVAKVIAPALAAGRDVVTDRYIYSSLAYQGFGRELGVDVVRSLSDFAGAPEADLVILFTLSPDVRKARRGDARDRIEADDEAFHRRVEQGFLELAAADPQRWTVIEAAGTVEDVADLVWIKVNARM